MRLVRLGPAGAEIPCAALDDGTFLDVRPVLDPDGPSGDIGPAFFATGGLDVVAAALEAGILHPLEGAGDLRVGAPIARPARSSASA